MPKLIIKTGEVLSWKPNEDDCGVLRYNEDGQLELIARIANLETKPTVQPEGAINLITPYCLEKLRRTFPTTNLLRHVVKSPFKGKPRGKNVQKV